MLSTSVAARTPSLEYLHYLGVVSSSYWWLGKAAHKWNEVANSVAKALSCSWQARLTFQNAYRVCDLQDGCFLCVCFFCSCFFFFFSIFLTNDRKMSTKKQSKEKGRKTGNNLFWKTIICVDMFVLIWEKGSWFPFWLCVNVIIQFGIFQVMIDWV